MHNNRLHVALECKSQVVPSFGNNANNRSDEAIGNAECPLTAFRERRLGDTVTHPFFGYVFVLEDRPKVHEPVPIQEPHFPVDPAFLFQPETLIRQRRAGVSYAKRYEMLIERLLLESKYDAGCLTLAKKGPPPTVAFPNAALSAQNFLARLHGFVVGAVASGL
ncbi:MAG TPA: PaeR7I family type II restriction endonuclease [Candidatus Baltobacteraceae bacterium]|nr:PaeR7I family type II restriction endonuclease [Candidatus Baltobacteraceae bacterium]